jgi:acetyl-CoA acetyltransferase
MRDVAVVAFVQSPMEADAGDRNEVEILLPVVSEILGETGINRHEIGFACSGTCDYLAGAPFAFVSALDAVGAWPPIQESHVEMDGAWALYEAWVRLQHGDIDTALVYCVGKSSLGDLGAVLALQLDPYVLAPLWPDPHALAALQARTLVDAGRVSEAQLADVVVRSRAAAATNPFAATIAGQPPSVDSFLAEPYVASPLRASDCPPVTDGAAAVVLAVGDKARELCSRPAWIRGIDHRIEAHALGSRDLTSSPSTRLAGERAGVNGVAFDVAELHAPYSYQELVLRDALGIGDGVDVNPSGGALCANALMVAGLVRIGEAARRIHEGGASRALAHATSGPCLQQNLVCVLEAE